VPLSTYREQARGGKGRAGMQTRDDDFVARLFVASTHTPILFFSSRGQVYKEKVWRIPVANPQSRGKALVNMLPLEQGERITTIMPLPEDEEKWAELDVLFATTSGSVRRNKLSDFTQVNRAGKIAMKLDAGEEIVDVQTCGEASDVLLTTQNGQCIRFATTEVRVFKGRDSMGVRGITLGKDDRVIALAILRHIAADAGERLAYLKMRRAVAGEVESTAEAVAEEAAEEGVEPDTVQPSSISQERYVEMSEAEDFILTVSTKGFGKRTSSYEYRLTRRGGKGIVAMAVNARNGQLVASFPVTHDDGIMLVTNGGQLIRVPVDDIRIVGRGSQGVTVFRTAPGEQVVSVERIRAEVEAAPDGSAAPEPTPDDA
jgi:DNA gyrase subunit A